MNRHIAFLMMAATLFTFAACSGESETSITQSEVPPAILQALTSKYPAAKVREYSAETEKGKKLYEISFISDGKAFDVTYNEDGQIVETEEEVSSEGLPENIKNEIAKSFKKFELTKVEKIQEGGKIFYEARLTAFEGGKKQAYEIKYSEAGKLMEKEKKGQE